MVEREVRKERSGWRDPELAEWHHKHGFAYSRADINDLDLNDRHRKWGWNCPAVDIDKLFIEYNHCLPVAVMDYKLRESLYVPEPNRSSANNRATSNLCRENVPFFVTIYTKYPWNFRPIWINARARELAPQKQFLTEVEFVEYLYHLRGCVVPSSIASELDNQISWPSLPPVSTPHRRNSHRRKQSVVGAPTLFDPDPVQQYPLWEVLV